jgi:hypothetical protein
MCLGLIRKGKDLGYSSNRGSSGAPGAPALRSERFQVRKTLLRFEKQSAAR